MFGLHHLVLRSLFFMIISSAVISGLRVTPDIKSHRSANNSQKPMDHPDNNRIEPWKKDTETLTNVQNVSPEFRPRRGHTSNHIARSRKRRKTKEEYASYASQLFAKLNPLCDRRKRAVVLYVGSALMLDCDLCGYVKTDAMWTKLPLEALDQEYTDPFTGQEIVIPAQEHSPDLYPSTPFYMEDLALGVQRVDRHNEGIYQCKTEAMIKGNELIRSLPLSSYYVEVKEFHGIQEVNLDVGERPRIDGPTEGGRPRDPDIFVYTSWSLWGQCSQCDIPGIRRRLGYCYALVKEDDFAGGVPCGSSLVPPEKVSKLAPYTDQQLVIPCRTRCRDRVDGSPFDSNASPLNVAGSNYYKKRVDDIQTFRLREGSHTRLVCPEAYYQDVVWWRKGAKKLMIPIERPTASLTEHTSRLFMDPDGSLIFTKLELNDTAIYRCDVNDRMTANYRIYVTEELMDREAAKKAFSSLTVVVVVYLTLFVLAILGRFYMKKKVQETIDRLQAEARLDLEAELEDNLPDD